MRRLRKIFGSFSRGTAMAETAITISFALLCLYGAMELGLIGYTQLQLDGATWFLTHGYAGQISAGAANLATLDTDLQPLFPNITLSAATFVFSNPPSTSVPPNFTQWGTTTFRYGGAAVLRPQQLQSQTSTLLTPTKNGAVWNGLGNVTLSGGNVDARPAVSNPDDDASGQSYNSTTTFVDPLVTDDQNVPPYYMAQGYMWYCTPFARKDNTSCPNAVLAALGLAEYLKHDNYNTSANGIDTNGTFNAIKCHQQVYAAISAALVLLGPSRPNKGTWDNSVYKLYLSNMYAPSSGTTGQSWDVAPVPSYGTPIVIPPPSDIDPTYGC